MNLFQRAVLFLLRTKSKAIVLLLILTIISALVLTCVSIGRATDAAAASLRASLGGYFKIEPDFDGGAVGYPDDKLIRDILRNGGIKAFNGMTIQYLMTDGLQLTPGRFTQQGDPKAHLARFLANTDSSLHEYFYLRSFTLTQGRHIRPDDRFAAVISAPLAADNGLGVGDTFTASYQPGALPAGSGDIQTGFDFTVVGIFEIDAEQTQDANRAELDIQENFIFTDIASIRAIDQNLSGFSSSVYGSGVSFFVEDPKELPRLTADLTEIPGVDWDGYKIIENNKAYNDSAVPLERMTGLITTFLIVIVIVSIVLLSLILVMWMRDRRREIGILMSLGIRKSAIIAQHIAENLFIAVVAFLIAWGISGIAADRLGSALLGGVAEQTQPVKDTHMDWEVYYDPVEVQSVNTGELLSVQVGVSELFLIFGIGFSIVVVSTGLSSILVVRMKPRAILSSFD